MINATASSDAVSVSMRKLGFTRRRIANPPRGPLNNPFETNAAGIPFSETPHQTSKANSLLTELGICAAHLEPHGHAVELQIFHLENGARGAIATPKNRPDASRKFGKCRRFCGVIVGTPIQATNALFEDRRAGHNQYGQVRLLRTDSPQNVQSRPRPVDSDPAKRDRTAGWKPSAGFSTKNNLHGKLFFCEPLVEKFRQGRVVFNDKNAHWLTPTA
jgi:hypothetical protein